MSDSFHRHASSSEEATTRDTELETFAADEYISQTELNEVDPDNQFYKNICHSCKYYQDDQIN